MSLTLGEKLRQAREERGITISEVAEQTRISPLYIESIERDDYRTLPGGIFNKGFVKSFAKYVGVDEQEALQQYVGLSANQVSVAPEETRTRRSEVLTDDRRSSSRLTTVVFAGVILALMAAGVLMLVKYIEPIASQTAANAPENQNNQNVNAANVAVTNVAAPTPASVSMNNLKVEIRAVKSPVSLVSTADGVKANALLAADAAKVFAPKEAMRFSYSKSKSENVRLLINDKEIATPDAPENPNRSVIEFEINKDNLQQIWDSGRISYGSRAALPQ